MDEMRAGELNARVILKKPVLSRSSFRELTATYTEVDTVFAAVEWQSGRRFEEAKKLNSEVQGVIRIRYRTDVKTTWRITYGSRTMQILTLSDVKERRQEIVLWVKEAKD